MQRELALALDADVICPAHGDIAEVTLHLLNQCWVDVSVLLMASIKKAQKPETAALLSILNRYRRSLERLLDAPFGSVEIIPLQEWEDVVDKLSCRLLLPMQG